MLFITSAAPYFLAVGGLNLGTNSFPQKKNGIASDGINDNDDDSSSLSERQEKRKPRSKNKFQLKILRRLSTRNGVEEVSFSPISMSSVGC